MLQAYILTLSEVYNMGEKKKALEVERVEPIKEPVKKIEKPMLKLSKFSLNKKGVK